VEQNSVSHIDKKGMAGSVASGEKTLMIETLGEIPGTVLVTQQVTYLIPFFFKEPLNYYMVSVIAFSKLSKCH
jgi:hypothetical protein